MSEAWKIGLLSTRSYPLLPYLLETLATCERIRPLLLLDGQDFKEKDKLIFQERTQGSFPQKSLDPFLARMPWVDVPNHNDLQTREAIAGHGVQLLINAGTPRRLSSELLNAAPRGVLNVHPGLLPKYRGATCCEWAIYNDDAVGVTAHFMDEELDSGPILFSEELPVQKGQTYVDVRVALYRLSHRVLEKAIRMIFEKDLRPERLAPQGEGTVHKPIPAALLDEVKRKLAVGTYRRALPV